jgi:Flp pilus assembly secretin CpaC
MSLLFCWTCLTALATDSGSVQTPVPQPAGRTVSQDDLAAFQVYLRKVAPHARVEASPMCSDVILTGRVDSREKLETVLATARAFFGPKIVNGMSVGTGEQVQLDVIMAVVDRKKIRSLADLHRNQGKETNTCCIKIIQDREQLLARLNTLCHENSAKIVTRPSVTTLSHRSAYIVDGGEMAVFEESSEGRTVSHKNVGTVVNLLPIVMSNGKIHLEVQPEISYPEEANDTTSWSTDSARVAVQMENSQTLLIGGLKALPEYGKGKEMLILVTPHCPE